MRSDSPSTVFDRLRQYARSLSRDAREDRLTEALAVTLNAAPDAAAYLVRRLFQPEALPSVLPKANTQVQVGERKRVDLELTFGSARRELMVWFESKVDSPAYRSQGEEYMRRLEEIGAPWEFAWLTRAEASVAGDVPEQAKHTNWQELAETLRDWLNGHAVEDLGTRGPWFVQQFLEHLEKEEMLAQTDPFSTDDAKALRHFRAAEKALDHLVEATAHKAWDVWGRHPADDVVRLQEAWDGDDKEWKWKKVGERWLAWFKYPCVEAGGESAWPESWWFEFDLRYDDWHSETRTEQLAICAGLAFRAKDRGLNDTQFDDYVERLARGGFKHGQVGGGADPWDVFLTHQTLDELAERLEGQAVSDQVKTLTGWVTKAFHQLNEIGPPVRLTH